METSHDFLRPYQFQMRGSCLEMTKSRAVLGENREKSTARTGTPASHLLLANDPVIRATLRNHLRSQHPTARIVDELATGASRMDVAVIADVLTGFEIKSWRDTLTRLTQQAFDYSRICDLACVVAPIRHLDAALLIVPEWWGLLLVLPKGDGVTLLPVREMQQNPAIDVKRLAHLLWRDEMLAVLAEHGVTRRVSSKPRAHLVDVLHGDVPLPALRTSILRTLRARSNWRPDVVAA